MLIHHHAPNTTLLSRMLLVLSCFGCVCMGLSAQERQPTRGFTAGNSYAVSQIEQVNTTNGNLMLNLPLAALPPGRGGSPGASLNLQYNSKLWDSVGKKGVDGTPDETGFTKYFYDELTASDTGGWSYNLKYRLELISRLNLEPHPVCSTSNEYNKQIFIWKIRLHSPDGSVHEMVPVGGEDHFIDGYYKLGPNGEVQTASVITVGGGEYSCSLGSYTNTTGGMVYYSTDGSFIRLKIEYVPGNDGFAALANPWTLYFPDGRRVVNSANPERDGYFQRMYDRLDHHTDVKRVTYNGLGGTAIEDEIGRVIMLLNDSEKNRDLVVLHGVAGEDVTTIITWKTVYVNRIYDARVPGTFNAPYGISHHSAFSQWNMVAQITLPEQAGSQSYTFGYNGVDTIPDAEDMTMGWGELNALTLPTGASVNYRYVLDDTDTRQTTEIMNNTLAEKVLTYDREYDGSVTSTSETWTYSLPNGGASGSSFVTGPDGGVTREDYDYGYAYRTTMPNGTVVERIWSKNNPEDRSYAAGAIVNAYVKTEFTSIPNASGTLTWTAIKDFTYDKNGNLTQIKEYDWLAYSDIPRSGGRPTGVPSTASSKLKRITNNTYNALTPTASADPDENTDIYIYTASPVLKGTLLSSEITSGSNVVAARTEFTYDNPDDTGNLTQQLIWDSTRGNVSTPLIGGSSGNALAVTHTYDSDGNLLTTTDARGMVSQFTYGNISGPSGNVTGLYPTQTIAAYGTGRARTATAVYDFYTGLVTTATDEDNDVSTVTTYDDLGRRVMVKAAYGLLSETRVATTYDDANRRVIVRSDLNVAGDGKIVKIQHFDQLGRVRLTRVLEDPVNEDPTQETDGIKVQTRYGLESGYRYQITSNPYRATTSVGATGELTMGWTRAKSLTDGSRAEVETFSGVGLPAPVGSNASSTGKVVTLIDANKSYVRDQADKWRMSESNALGQLVKVTEDPTSSISGYTHTGTDILTEYSYDTLSNLTDVNMGYTSGGTPHTQPRSFEYSSVSRMLSATNPESGAITYEYDANGNLTKKKDARSVVTTYAYDELNRPTGRSYSDGTPTVTYTYDNGSVPYGMGKLASVGNAVGSTSISTTAYTAYDPLGRVLSSTQTTAGLTQCRGSSATCSMTYKYNLAGALTEETYPSGRIVHHNYAPDGKLKAVSSRLSINKPNKSYGQNFSYNATGAVTGMQLGNMRWESTVFNSRMQPTQIALGTTPSATDMLDLDYTYGTTDNNGNVMSQTISVLSVGATPGFIATQSYTYDELNRLKSATEMSTPTGGAAAQSWKQTYSFDRFGNRRFDTASGATTTIPGACSTAVCNPTFDLANNRFAGNQGYEYDAVGNLTDDAEGKKFAYDGENKQRTFGTGGSSTNGGSFVYDGDGRRVKKIVGTEVTIFVYNASGQLIGEYKSTPAYSPQVNYLTVDTLGTPRINTSASGAVIARHDYAPYGEEISSGGRGSVYGSDQITRKFTSRERDNEGGPDFFQARYYSSVLGRFSSFDPIFVTALRIVDPQRLNLYVYSRNNPLKYVDPSGTDLIIVAPNEKEARRRFEIFQSGLRPEDRSHVQFFVGNGKRGYMRGCFYILVDSDYHSDSENFQVAQALANDRTAVARFHVLQRGATWTLRFISIRNGRPRLGSLSATFQGNEKDFDGLTLFEYRGPDSTELLSAGRYTEAYLAGDLSDVELAETMHHELRHVLLGDFGRSAPRARHSDAYARGTGEPTTEADLSAGRAEEEARRNAALPSPK